MLQTKVVEKIITNILHPELFFFFNHAIYETLLKHRTMHATDDHMVHGHCMLDN